ncbi:unnamed protein product [Microthlaspi erraticum]|uniref:Reverse transcriptase domain-containing protein n=1 Tax=Microthlaspi erraticum TaxID=1685480 RepID=A0A6D2L0K8_9BRAS|nr:unnamed protein product [Microthlaspi erraticum]
MVKRCLFQMPLNKTPGPDGFPAEFFKATWDILGSEVSSSVLNFFEANFMPTSLNSTSLVLIPKRPGAEELKDFRPIACLNTLYKIITKLLSERLKLVLPSIVLSNQTAFVKDRLLLENVLLATEVMQGYHKAGIGSRITLKVDISKAFDSVRWDFLLSVLQAYRFPLSFIKWIRCCVCSPSYSISINGVTSGYFKGKTGLRQGDPLSPILFVLIMNVLSFMLNKAAMEGVYNYHPGCEDLQLTHLCFADDLLIFLEGSERSLRGVLSVLSAFERMSGLGINLQKTSMFCQGLDATSLDNIKSHFNLEASSLPIRYLGLPLSSKKLSIGDCDPLIVQIQKKLDSWTNKFLSFAGRLTLLSSVISGIIGFWTSAFILPKKVIRRINSLSSSFLWHGRTGISTGAKVAWKLLSSPKMEGGLGIKDTVSWNNASILKLIWLLFFRAGSIWVAWIRRSYISNSSFWALNEKNYSYSWMFRKILKLRKLAIQFLRIKLGNGDSTFFWWDPWTLFGQLHVFLGEDGPSRLGIPLSATVSEVWDHTGWTLPPARTERQVTLHTYLLSVGCSSQSDRPIWLIKDIPQRSFSLFKVWDEIRLSKSEVAWAPILWHKAGLFRHQTTTWLFLLN